MAASRFEPDTSGVKFGPYWLMPGVSRANAVTLLFGGFSTVCVMSFMAFGQPFLFEVIGIPKGEQGALSGNLGVLHEAVLIALMSLVGAISENVGRRIVYVVGAVVLALGFVLYPFADSKLELFVYRAFYAVGASAVMVMMHTLFAEYSQEATRGKWMGLVGLSNGLGVTLMALLLAKTPDWYGRLGFTDMEAIRYSFWTFAAYLLFLAGMLRLGLKGHAIRTRRTENIFKLAVQGFAATRTNPRITLAYVMAFASRGDLAILTYFFSLWVVQAGVQSGMSLGESTAKAGMLFGLSQGVGLLWSLGMGLIINRINRMTSMCIAFGLATIGYFSLGLISDPFGSFIILACILAGMGEASAMVAGGVLIGQEAPARIRGVVLGTFSLMGTAGIMVLSFIGGRVFDGIGPTAPFVMMGIVNLIVFVSALSMRYDWARMIALAPGRLLGRAAVQIASYGRNIDRRD